MRLWTVHPRYLDAKGLVALWREALLAKAVLAGQTKGYRHHPQLVRFRAHPQPMVAACEYLRGVLDEALRRGYRFDATKIPAQPEPVAAIVETSGQLDYEWQHLRAKLALRDPVRLASYRAIERPDPHPLFTMVPGDVRHWEVQGTLGELSSRPQQFRRGSRDQHH